MNAMRAPVPAAAVTSVALLARRYFPRIETTRFLLQRAGDIMHYTNDWNKATRILARLMRGLLTGYTQGTPTSADFHSARYLQFLAAAPDSTSALTQGLLREDQGGGVDPGKIRPQQHGRRPMVYWAARYNAQHLPGLPDNEQLPPGRP